MKHSILDSCTQSTYSVSYSGNKTLCHKEKHTHTLKQLLVWGDIGGRNRKKKGNNLK